MGTEVQQNDTVTLILESLTDDGVTARVPHTDYQLELALEAPEGFDAAAGSRVRGSIHAQVLRIHPAKAGGMFSVPSGCSPIPPGMTICLP